MSNVRQAAAADAYVDAGSFHLTDSRDTFVFMTVQHIAKPVRPMMTCLTSTVTLTAETTTTAAVAARSRNGGGAIRPCRHGRIR